MKWTVWLWLLAAMSAKATAKDSRITAPKIWDDKALATSATIGRNNYPNEQAAQLAQGTRDFFGKSDRSHVVL